MCVDELEGFVDSSLKGTHVMRLSGITSLMSVGLLLASSALVAAPQRNQDSQSKDQTTTSQEHRNKKRGKHDKKMNKKQGETQTEQANPAPQH